MIACYMQCVQLGKKPLYTQCEEFTFTIRKCVFELETFTRNCFQLISNVVSTSSPTLVCVCACCVCVHVCVCVYVCVQEASLPQLVGSSLHNWNPLPVSRTCVLLIAKSEHGEVGVY